jgi:hypothetical protein
LENNSGRIKLDTTPPDSFAKKMSAVPMILPWISPRPTKKPYKKA